jgi:hypothetical protein
VIKRQCFIILCFVILIFTSFFRLLLLPQKKYTENDYIRLSGIISSEPKLQDNKIFVQIGNFNVIFNEYRVSQPLHVDDHLVLVGKPKVKVIAYFYQQILLVNPEIINKSSSKQNLMHFNKKIANFLNLKLKKIFPEPHSSLLAGVLLGINSNYSTNFYNFNFFILLIIYYLLPIPFRRITLQKFVHH